MASVMQPCPTQVQIHLQYIAVPSITLTIRAHIICKLNKFSRFPHSSAQYQIKVNCRLNSGAIADLFSFFMTGKCWLHHSFVIYQLPYYGSRIGDKFIQTSRTLTVFFHVLFFPRLDVVGSEFSMSIRRNLRSLNK